MPQTYPSSKLHRTSSGVNREYLNKENQPTVELALATMPNPYTSTITTRPLLEFNSMPFYYCPHESSPWQGHFPHRCYSTIPTTYRRLPISHMNLVAADETAHTHCPHCAALLDTQMRTNHLFCNACGIKFLKRGSVWDFRTFLVCEKNDWRADDFEKAYSHLSVIEDAFTHADCSGIPRFIEEYRISRCKDFLAQWIVAGSPHAILDVGCGSGWFDFRLRDKFGYSGTIAGVDVSPHNISLFITEISKRAEGKITAFAANGESLPFADNTFDKVVMTEVLEHVANPRRVIEEAHRVLRDTGELLLSTPSAPMRFFWKALFHVPRLLRHLIAPPSVSSPGRTPYDTPVPYREIRRMLSECGFDLTVHRTAVFLPHESYIQFFPRPAQHAFLALALLLEGVGWPAAFLGLHHLVRAVKK